MCIVSMIGDQWGRDFHRRYPDLLDRTSYPFGTPAHLQNNFDPEIIKLRKEVEELKKLLLAAKVYDKETGQPECQVDEKVASIKAVAKALGVDMKGVFEDED